MKVLVLAWEFPPRLVGGIARHVAELYPKIVELNHEVHLITVESADAPAQETIEGIRVHRVPVAPGNDFFHWIVNMNQSMGHYGGKLIEQEGDFDLIHAHDWLVGDAAIALKHTFKIPLIATIHATECGRNNGIHHHEQRYIDSKEKILVDNAWRVIVCSHYMRSEVARVLHCSGNKIDIIYNGIRAEKKSLKKNFNYKAFRRRFAHDEQQIVYYVGRMTYEKGVSVLLNAAPQVLKQMNGKVKFVIIGGGNVEPLKQQAAHMGIWHQCYFTGFMADRDLDKFQTIADCAVFPSLYEPFGIVALESFAARVPVVVSNAGGLSEVVQHDQTGIVTQKNSSHSLAQGIVKILQNRDYAQLLVKNAYDSLANRFDWNQLAQQTLDVYGKVVKERLFIDW